MQTPRSVHKTITAILAVSGLFTVVTFSGCGAEQYEQRLVATARLLEHAQVLDDNLDSSQTVRGEQMLLSFRPPQEFIPMLLETSTEPTGTTSSEDPVADPRQPYFFKSPLPALAGTWKSNVTIKRDKKITKQDAYLFLMSNVINSSKPSETLLSDEVMQIVASELSLDLESVTSQEVMFPPQASHGYVEPVPYSWWTIEPEVVIGGSRMVFSVYAHRFEDVEAIFLFVIPENVERSEELRRRIELSLETLTLTDAKNPTVENSQESDLSSSH